MASPISLTLSPDTSRNLLILFFSSCTPSPQHTSYPSSTPLHPSEPLLPVHHASLQHPPAKAPYVLQYSFIPLHPYSYCTPHSSATPRPRITPNPQGSMPALSPRPQQASLREGAGAELWAGPRPQGRGLLRATGWAGPDGSWGGKGAWSGAGGGPGMGKGHGLRRGRGLRQAGTRTAGGGVALPPRGGAERREGAEGAWSTRSGRVWAG